MPIPSKYLASFKPGECYHVYNRSHSGKLMFNKPDDYSLFFYLMKEHLCQWMDFYTYNLLPNHFHLIVKIKDIVRINIDEIIPTHKIVSNQFRELFIAYTASINKHNGLHGGIFCTPYRRILIDCPNYFTHALFYINHNAVHHKICKRITDYKYSGYNSLISNKTTLLKRKEVFDWFGGRDQFIEYHKTKNEDYLTKPFYYEYK